MTQRVTGEIAHLAQAEGRAIARHREYLSEVRGESVSLEDARSDWQANYAQKWRQACLARMLEQQREEINRHKWIESEKANCDIGKEAALDWIMRYAGRWRKWYDENEGLDTLTDLYRESR